MNVLIMSQRTFTRQPPRPSLEVCTQTFLLPTVQSSLLLRPSCHPSHPVDPAQPGGGWAALVKMALDGGPGSGSGSASSSVAIQFLTWALSSNHLNGTMA